MCKCVMWVACEAIDDIQPMSARVGSLVRHDLAGQLYAYGRKRWRHSGARGVQGAWLFKTILPALRAALGGLSPAELRNVCAHLTTRIPSRVCFVLNGRPPNK